MSMLGPQEALTTTPEGEWEMVGRDMIRTKRNADGSGGMIVAQFWTAPTPEHAAMMVAAREMLTALIDLYTFVSQHALVPDRNYHTVTAAAAAIAKAGGGA